MFLFLTISLELSQFLQLPSFSTKSKKMAIEVFDTFTWNSYLTLATKYLLVIYCTQSVFQLKHCNDVKRICMLKNQVDEYLLFRLPSSSEEPKARKPFY